MDKGIAMGLFRAPASRIVSGFNAGFHHYGMSKRMVGEMKESILSDLSKNGMAAALKTYAEWPGIAHCQTKMLLGVACASNKIPNLSENDVARAIDVLRNGFAFVGTYATVASMSSRPVLRFTHFLACLPASTLQG